MAHASPASTLSRAVRLAMYSDYSYHVTNDELRAECSFALFVGRLERELERIVLIGRVNPDPGRTPYPLGGVAGFVPLPYYASLAHPLAVARATGRSLVRFWRVLGRADLVWLFGPHPIAIVFALLARLRRRRVILGVRQNFPAYVRSRHPRRYDLRGAAWVLERSFRGLARRLPVVVVGPEAARAYGRSRAVLETVVSLVEPEEIVPVEKAAAKPYDGELTVLSVGRLDAEKNPLLLAEVLALLNTGERRWRLVVCGEGAMKEELAARLTALGLSDRAELRGYVPLHEGLLDAYRSSHLLLHVSWTEGLPQVLLEAFAAGLPAVATDVGGIAAAVGPAASIVPPGEARAAAAALRSLAGDPMLRRRRIEAGHEFARAHTLDAEVRRVARFLHAAG